MSNNGDTVPHWAWQIGHTDKRQLALMTVFQELCVASSVKRHPRVLLFPFAIFVYFTNIGVALYKEKF